MQQATDFLEESRDLYAQVCDLNVSALAAVTGFKAWTILDVIRHLHFWNRMALLALEDGEGFNAEMAPVAEALMAGESLNSYESRTCEISDTELVATWRAMFEQVAAAYGRADPSQRCTWAGPSMSARSCITARQMETWAHGHEVYDRLGRERRNTDRLRNIVVLGVNTFGWSFQVRGESPPETLPYLELTAPSGELWHFGEPQEHNTIRGSAEGFAQTVTQTRNVEDTDLVVQGESALRWMRCAQCFAGGVSTPPEPGSRGIHAG